MKLAIICEMPRVVAKVLTGPIDVSFGGVPIATVEADLNRIEWDLSAYAEKSARDAFAYCPGPFESMEFVKRCDKAACDKADGTAQWILLMGHDCLVDIQAFEVFAETVALSRGREIDEVIFPRWTASGLARDCSQFSFQQTPFAWLESPAPAKRRILIEPESNASPSP